MPLPKKIVCLGDSITCNWYKPSYVNVLQEMATEQFPTDQTEFVAAGINGEIAQDAYYRLDRDVVAHSPDLVTIMLGHNDADINRNTSPVLFANYIRKIINYLQHVSKAHLLLVSPQQVGSSELALRYQPYLEQLKLAATDKKLQYVSLWEVFAEHDLTSIYTGTINSTYLHGSGPDYVHPNELGQKRIADKLLTRLTEMHLH